MNWKNWIIRTRIHYVPLFENEKLKNKMSKIIALKIIYLWEIPILNKNPLSFDRSLKLITFDAKLNQLQQHQLQKNQERFVVIWNVRIFWKQSNSLENMIVPWFVVLEYEFFMNAWSRWKNGVRITEPKNDAIIQNDTLNTNTTFVATSNRCVRCNDIICK